MTDASDPTNRPPAAPPWCRAAAEAVLLVLVASSPWLFASTSPLAVFALCVGVGVLTALWAVHVVLSRRLTIRPDLPSACLAGLMLLSVVQLVPLPEVVVGVVSPSALDWHRAFRPEVGELLPDEPGPPPARPGWLSLTVDPDQTRRFLGRVAAVLLIYLVVRNWLAGREAFRRLGWTAAVTGGGLAVLAIAQFLSSPRDTVFWTVATKGQVFGPFVCKNHYPDYVGPCLGLAAGLVFAARNPSKKKGGGFDTPGRVLAGAAAAMMAASLPFSLSRGGMLATAAAAALVGMIAVRKRPTGNGLWAAGLAAAVVGLAGWFGWEPVEARLRTLWTTDAGADRLPVWRDALRQVGGVPLVGTGNGTFARAELLARTSSIGPILEYDHAHNEYVEAVVEGGLVRLLLTLGLVAGAVTAGVRATVRVAGRSSAGLAVGGLFGVVLLAVHSLVDFGIHTPAVAVLLAAITAHLSAAATDAGYLPQRVRVERDGATMTVVQPDVETDRGRPLVGSAAVAAAAGLVAVAAAVTWDAGLRAAADRFRQVVLIAATDKDRLTAAAGLTAAAPNATDAHLELARAHFDAGRAEAELAVLGAFGGPAGVLPAEPTPDHRRAGLIAARAARDACPLSAAAQVALGRFAGGFASADPMVRLAAAAEAAKAGDRAAAVADWQEALKRSPRFIRQVLVAARSSGLSPDRIVTELLPADAAVLVAAADALYPPGDPGRKPFLTAAVAATGDGHDQFAAAAAAFGELGDAARAEEVWQQAVDAADRRSAADGARVRDRFAGWLEAAERYERAAAVLRWLTKAEPRNGGHRDRLLAAEHAAKLEKEIEGR